MEFDFSNTRPAKQKVLIVHNYYQIPGGEDIVVKNEKKLLEDNGHEVVLYTRNNTIIKKFNIFQKAMLPMKMIFNIRTYQEVKQIIKTKDIDIVHVHNTLNLISPSVYYAALECHVPVVQTVHNFRLLCPGATFYRDKHICEDCISKGLRCAIKHSCYRGSKLQTLVCVISMWIHRRIGTYGKINYICLTDFNKEKLLNLKVIKKENVFVKPNFVFLDMSNRYNKNKKNYFIYTGRLDELKGIKLLFNAWNKMKDKSYQLLVYGRGPLDAWCKKFIKDNPKCNIQMKGFVDNKEVKKMLWGAKALILPTQCYEGFPMTILEAYSVGTPVIGSDIGNVGNVIKEGISGYKFKSDSEEEMLRCIDMVCNNNLRIDKDNIMMYGERKNYEILSKIYNIVEGQ